MTQAQLVEAAIACWEQLKAQLEDRSVLELGMIDDDVLDELEVEQIDTITTAMGSLIKTEEGK